MKKIVIVLSVLCAFSLSLNAQNRRVVSTTATTRQVLTTDSTEIKKQQVEAKQEQEIQERLKAEKQERERLQAEIDRIEKEREDAKLAEEARVAREKGEKALSDSLERVRVENEKKALDEKYATQDAEIARMREELESLKTEQKTSTYIDYKEHKQYVYVDLGLSVKWATCNIGANNPEEYGKYYAWGETSTKSEYNWSTYKYCNGSSKTLIVKYNSRSSYGIVDNKITLEKSDDIVYQELGGGWRIPTDAEWTELRTKCKWVWTVKNGVYGYSISASNGNSIFLPAAGYHHDSNIKNIGSYGYYWSSSIYEDYPYYALYINFNSNNISRFSNIRYEGQSIRPVYSE